MGMPTFLTLGFNWNLSFKQKSVFEVLVASQLTLLILWFWHAHAENNSKAFTSVSLLLYKSLVELYSYPECVSVSYGHSFSDAYELF